MCTCENQTQRWRPTIQPADSKKSANSSSTEGIRWTPKDGRNGHHRANRLVRRYCDSTKERRWGADLHWQRKAEHCNQAWKICLTDSWRHPSQTEGIHHLYQVGCNERILANSTGWWISQTHYIHQSIWPIFLLQIATGRYICARNFPAHRGRDHCRWGAFCMFLRWHPGVQWKRRSSRKTLEEHHGKTEQCRHQAEQREVSVSSALEIDFLGFDFLGFVINKDDVKADPRKTEAILEMPDPTDIAELRHFLGMVNYLGRYLQNLSSVLQPVTELLEKDRAWTWGPPQISVVAKVMLTSAPTLAYFDPDKATTVSACRCEQLWAWRSSFARAPRWTLSCCLCF